MPLAHLRPQQLVVALQLDGLVERLGLLLRQRADLRLELLAARVSI